MYKWLLIFFILFTPSYVYGQGCDTDTQFLCHFDCGDGDTDAPDVSSTECGGGATDTITWNVTAQCDSGFQKFDNTLFLDGNSDTVSIPDSARVGFLESNSEDWTIDAWFKMDAHTNWDPLFEVHDADSDRLYLFHRDTGSGKDGWTFEAREDSVQELLVGADNCAEVGDTNWHHIAFIKEGQSYGIFSDSLQCGGKSSANIVNYTTAFVIGYQTSVNNWFDGNIDEFRIQNSNYFEVTPGTSCPSSGCVDFGDVPTEAYSVPPAPSGGPRIMMMRMSDGHEEEIEAWRNKRFVRVQDCSEWDLPDGECGYRRHRWDEDKDGNVVGEVVID